MYIMTNTSNTVNNASKAVLRNLCKQHGIKNYGNMNNAQMRSAVNTKLANRVMFKQGMQKADAQKTEKLKPLFNPTFSILAGTAPQTAQTAQAEQPVKRTKQRVRNGQWHPKIGGKTYSVWVQMRYALGVKKLGLKQAKVFVREYFANSDVHFNTVNAQIYRFCKYYGLTGK